LKDVRESAHNGFELLKKFQKATMDKVQVLLTTFLPNDFRMRIIKSQQQRSEAKREAEVQALIERGCSIKEKYDLYWQQQLQRREVLVSVGNASGAYKAILKYIGGVPQVLLDFVKTINQDDGPMDELRVIYGPNLYFLVEFLNFTNILLSAIIFVMSTQGPKKESLLPSLVEKVQLIKKAIERHQKEMEDYLTLMLRILENSPFFVTKDEANALSEETEVVVSADYSTHLDMEPGETINWTFHTKEKDIGFSVGFRTEYKTEEVVPMTRVNSHLDKVAGNYSAKESGQCWLTWDNSYSWLSKKTLVYSVFKDPPVQGNESELTEAIEELHIE